MDQFFTAYSNAVQRYADFGGRTSVGGFWRFVAVNLVVVVVLGLLGNVASIFYLFSLRYALAVLIPSLAVAVRRLHDTGKTGWLILIGLIPLVGFIILIVFYVQQSESQANRWGPPPAPGT